MPSCAGTLIITETEVMCKYDPHLGMWASEVRLLTIFFHWPSSGGDRDVNKTIFFEKRERCTSIGIANTNNICLYNLWPLP